MEKRVDWKTVVLIAVATIVGYAVVGAFAMIVSKYGPLSAAGLR